MTTHIQPTVGRVLWFFPGGKSALESGQQPCKADIAFVHSPNRINIGYLTHEGQAQSATGVHLVQHGEPLTEGPFCTWPPSPKLASIPQTAPGRPV